MKLQYKDKSIDLVECKSFYSRLRGFMFCKNITKSLLLVDTHHIIMDGASIHILRRDFCKLYNGEKIDDKALEVFENQKMSAEFIKNYYGKDMNVINLSCDLTGINNYIVDGFWGNPENFFEETVMGVDETESYETIFFIF